MPPLTRFTPNYSFYLIHFVSIIIVVYFLMNLGTHFPFELGLHPTVTYHHFNPRVLLIPILGLILPLIIGLSFI
jgi:hypothetical protein